MFSREHLKLYISSNTRVRERLAPFKGGGLVECAKKDAEMYMCMFVNVSATYIFFTLSSPFVTLVVIWRFAKNPFSCFFGVVLIVNGHLRRRQPFGMVFVVVALLAFLLSRRLF